MNEEAQHELNLLYGYDTDRQDRNWLKSFLEYLKQEKERDMQRMRKVV